MDVLQETGNCPAMKLAHRSTKWNLTKCVHCCPKCFPNRAKQNTNHMSHWLNIALQRRHTHRSTMLTTSSIVYYHFRHFPPSRKKLAKVIHWKKLAGRRTAVKLFHLSAMLSKSEIVCCHLALPSIALEKRNKDIKQIAERRPAMNLCHYSSKLNKSRSA